MFHSGTSYWPSGKGFLCSDENYRSVTDRDECRRAFTVIQDEYDPNTKEEIRHNDNWNNRPKGCFLNSPNNVIMWNPHSTGSRNAEDHQICKLNGK